jgi:PAS domain S-box-containing protein
MTLNKANFVVLLGLLLLTFGCTKPIIVNKSEKEWLKHHPGLTVGISPHAPPYEFVNSKGEVCGIFMDFLSLIETRLDYKFKKVYQSDFARLLSDARNGSVDVLTDIQKTGERQLYLKFTPHLVSHPHVIVVRKSQKGITSVEDLKDKTVSVVNKYAVQEYLARTYPYLTLAPQMDDIECLRSVSMGQTDAFICQQAVAVYYIETEGISNLMISGEINYKNDLAFASRKDLDTLNIILTKAVTSINEKDKQRIYKKWLSFTVKPFYQESRFWLISIVAILSVFLFLILVNQALQKRVTQKTQELEIAKDKARESENKFRDILDNTKIHLWAFDGTTYTYCNRNWYEYTGQDTNTLLSIELWLSFVHPDDAEKSAEIWQKNWVAQSEYNSVFRLRRYDGIYRYFHNHSVPIYNTDGSFKHFLGYNIEITEQVEAEEKLTKQNQEYAFLNQQYKDQNADLIKAKAQADESERLKSAFLANMSHEIRTPMNGILGFASLLAEPGLSGENQQEYIRIIEKSGKRMLNIINDIIDISRIESGQIKVSVTETNINDQIRFIHAFFKPDAVAKGLGLTCFNHLPDHEAVIRTDREKIYAILTNLVKNAIKYSDSGSIELGYVLKPSVSMPTAEVCTTVKHRGRAISSLLSAHEPVELEFYVKDTGIGIPENRQKAIFDRFIQADIADVRAFQGAGLGLSISRAYVEMLGGTIRVVSTPGKGAVFYFTLPCNPEPKNESSLPIGVSSLETAAPMRTLKILIAEDDEISEKLLSSAVKPFSNQILCVGSGLEAVEICRLNTDIDLVLMDIKMPGIDGYEATRQIRQFNTRTVIIAQTAYGVIDDREMALRAGCNDYISKPVNISFLKKLIYKHIDNWHPDGLG